MSLNDDNLRRLLFYSKFERERSGRQEGEHRIGKGPRHFAILGKPDEASNLFDFTETTLAALGVRPLWIDEFTNIPKKFEVLVKRRCAPCLHAGAQLNVHLGTGACGMLTIQVSL